MAHDKVKLRNGQKITIIFFIYNGLPPNNSHFQKVFTNILTQKAWRYPK